MIAVSVHALLPTIQMEAGFVRHTVRPLRASSSRREAGQRSTSLASTSVPFRLRQAVNALRSTAMLPLPNSGKTRAGRDGVENFGLLTVALPESANSRRVTMQTPQRLDAEHSGELFPVQREQADAYSAG